LTMGGRGRGRGKASFSFSVESLGIVPGEALPGPMLQPPPDFPILEFLPAPMYMSSRASDQLTCRGNLLSSLSCYRDTIVYNKDVAFSKKDSENSERDTPLGFYWPRLPPELRPVQKKRKASQPKAVKQPKVANIDQLLSKLEEAEFKAVKTEPEDEENENKKAGKTDPGEDVEEEFDGESDEEMDEGTDYNQNYFDNGEDYLDEDDDEEGPTY